MDDDIDELLIEVRAGTRGFAADIAEMRGTFDATLLQGFDKAGSVLERSLLGAIRKGGIGFEDLARTALQAMDRIAAQAVQSGIGNLFGQNKGTSGGGGIGGLLGGALGAIFGLPGRATGGPVSPGRGYLVGERGPELFVPTSAGRVEPNRGDPASRRDVRVSIQLATPKGTSAPAALQRSSRQVASAISRSLR